MTMATKENTAQKTIEKNPIHRLPHLSKNKARIMAAGNSVMDAKEKEVNTSG